MMRLEECLSFVIGKAAQQVTRRSRDALAPFGVTPVQYAALSALWERDGQSGAELCIRLVLDSATVTGIADRLEAAGLIARRADPHGDRRVHRMYLTDRGQALAAPLNEVMEILNQRFALELGDRQAPVFWDALRQIGEVRIDEGEAPPSKRARKSGRPVS